MTFGIPYNKYSIIIVELKRMRLNKKITVILSVLYLFFSLGISNYAFCMQSFNQNKSGERIIRCACCVHKKNHCNCLKQKTMPYSANIQLLNYVNYTSEIQNTSNQTNFIFNPIIYKGFDNKLQTKQIILISNKNLEMLRTVILLI